MGKRDQHKKLHEKFKKNIKSAVPGGWEAMPPKFDDLKIGDVGYLNADGFNRVSSLRKKFLSEFEELDQLTEKSRKLLTVPTVDGEERKKSFSDEVGASLSTVVNLEVSAEEKLTGITAKVQFSYKISESFVIIYRADDLIQKEIEDPIEFLGDLREKNASIFDRYNKGVDLVSADGTETIVHHPLWIVIGTLQPSTAFYYRGEVKNITTQSMFKIDFPMGSAGVNLGFECGVKSESCEFSKTGFKGKVGPIALWLARVETDGFNLISPTIILRNRLFAAAPSSPDELLLQEEEESYILPYETLLNENKIDCTWKLKTQFEEDNEDEEEIPVSDESEESAADVKRMKTE